VSHRRPRVAWISGLLVATVMLSTGAPAGAVVGPPVAEDSLSFVAKIETVGRACTGVLVTPQWVLTASSCFAEAGGTVTAGAPKQPTTATIGRTTLSSTKGRVASVVELVPHENRNLVLARLQTRVDIAPVAIGTAAPVAGDTLRVAGYGRTATEWVPDQLHAGSFTVQAVQASTVSIAGATSDAAICKGDAGGPALREANGKVELVAISSTSWQHGCSGETETRNGATETRVDDLADWIKQKAVPHASTGSDINGDGRDDIVVGYDQGNANMTLFGWRGAPNGISGNPVSQWSSGPGNWENYRARFVTGDFDGDGKSDVAAFYDYGGGRTGLWVFTATATGFTLDLKWDSGPGNWDSNQAKYVTGDFNGDGKTDIGAFYYYGGGQTKLVLMTSTGGGFTRSDSWLSGPGNWENDRARFVAGDFNGDGKADIAAFYDYSGARTGLWQFTSNGTGFTLDLKWDSGPGNWDSGRAKYVAGDFNGDGKTDIGGFYYYDGGQTAYWAFTSNGTGFTLDQKWSSGAGNWENNLATFVAGDFNGDGKADIAAFYDYPWGLTRIYVANGGPTGIVTPLFSYQGWESPSGTWSGPSAKIISTSAN
jgi:hypothetical protein